jgi:putative transposase
MPDHMHLIWMGMQRDTDQKNGIKFLREHLGTFLNPHRFQHQAHDSVLRPEQRRRNAFSKLCFYIIDNPRKKGFVEDPGEWKFNGAIIPGYPTMHPLDDDFWPKFWKLYFANLAPNAGEIVRPPF